MDLKENKTVKAAVFKVFLLVGVLAAVKVIIMSRAPWWDLPLEAITKWTTIALAVSLPLCVWIASGRGWALNVLAVLGGTWTLATVLVSIQTKNFWLGLFSLTLAVFWFAVVSWLRYQMRRSFFNPNMKWYQGLPRPIPNLNCTLSYQAKGKAYSGKFRVSRLDRDGAFVFYDPRLREDKIARFPTRGKVELKFRYKDKEIAAPAFLVRKVGKETGLGLQFSNMEPDRVKHLFDFVEALHGEGYV